MPYGVTPQGFVVKPLDQCLAELQALAKGTFGAGIKVNPSSKWGQFLGILAERESDIWDLAQDTYASRDPDQASGTALEGLCALTGARRAEARKSKVTATLGGVAGTVIEAGKVASVTGTGARFALVADATVGVGGTVDAVLEAEEVGPVPAPAGTLTEIETPVAGWATVTNALDAELGANIETDGSLRLKRLATLALPGSAALDAIVAEVADVAGVLVALGFENTGMVADGNGLPPKSVEILVSGGVDADIAAAIWRAKGGGIETYGGVPVVVVDRSGSNQTVKFSRPTEQQVHLVIGIRKTDDYPADGDAQLKAAVVAYGDAHYGVGADVIPRALIPSVLSVAGVYDVPHVYAGLAPAPASEANIAIGARDYAQLDTARITVQYV